MSVLQARNHQGLANMWPVCYMHYIVSSMMGKSSRSKHAPRYQYGLTLLYILDHIRLLTVLPSVLFFFLLLQRLQTFHHSKPYKGLQIKPADMSAFHQRSFMYDPRPKRFRCCAAYAVGFQNTVINFQVHEILIKSLWWLLMILGCCH